MAPNERFSVIILCYNNSNLLTSCINSVLKQTYSDIEIIIADDGSEEFETNILLRYIEEKKNINIKRVLIYQNEENIGTVKNINKALEKVTGTYIKLIAADDAFYDNKALFMARQALDISPDGMIISDTCICDSTLKPLKRRQKYNQKKLAGLTPEKLFKKLCVSNCIKAQGVFLTQRFFNKFGYFNEEYRLLEDWPKWLEAIHLGCRPLYLSSITVKYRTNCGIGTGANPIYLKDKKSVLNNYIIPSKHELGFLTYLLARINFTFTTSSLIRKIYGLLFRK